MDITKGEVMTGKKQQSEQQKELRDLNVPLGAYFDVDLLDLVVKPAPPKPPNAKIKSPRDAASGQAKS